MYSTGVRPQNSAPSKTLVQYSILMKPHTRDAEKTEVNRQEISSTQLFAAFSEERRQHALAYLAQKPAAIHLGDLAEYIALKEQDPSHDWYQRIIVDLHHQHLPHLCDSSLVRYDPETELVELVVDRDVVAPYLQLTEHAD